MVVTPDPQRRRERGQLVLIAAILVAVAVLGAVVLLNTVHSSPNVKAQTDAQSVSDAERTTAQLQADLETLFVATNTTDGEQYPFVEDEDELNETIEQYKYQLVEMLSTNKSALVNITYDSGRKGHFVKGETSTSGNKIVDANSIPSLSTTSDEKVEIEFSYDTPSGSTSKIIALDGGATTVAGESCSISDEELTLEFSRGSGAIRNESGGVCIVDLYDPEEISDITVNIDGSDGSFALTGVDPGSSSGETVIRDVIVNPRFEIEYIDPNVEYNSEFWLFGGDRR